MIKSFKSRETEKIFHGRFSSKLPQAIQRIAAIKLEMLHAATVLETLVTPRRINEIVHGRRAISADTALRLSHFFSMEALFWLNLQARYDIEVAMEELQDKIIKEVRPYSRVA